MSLVNWDLLDKQYLEMKEVLLAKKAPVGKVVISVATTEAMEWDTFLERAKGSMPVVVKDLLATLTHTDAVRLTAVNKFSASVAEIWPDIQEEIRRLKIDNAKLLQERHEYRKAIFNESIKR